MMHHVKRDGLTFAYDIDLDQMKPFSVALGHTDVHFEQNGRGFLDGEEVNVMDLVDFAEQILALSDPDIVARARARRLPQAQ